MTEPARYVMIGGFLGAGKTTAVARLARHLTDRGRRVGLICNDQSSGLVDTTLLRSRGLPGRGDHRRLLLLPLQLAAGGGREPDPDSRPDLFLAEPVGSCTDLVATVSYPLRRIYGDRFTVAPLSVLVDPVRAARMVGLVDGRSFSEKVIYVYRKQLQEADVIVVNKCDAHPADLIDRLSAALGEEFPHAAVLTCSARTGTGVEKWFETVLADNPASRSLEIDYDIYAAGEALLGWLNCTVQLHADEPFDGNRTLVDLARQVRGRLAAAGEEIAHLKMTLDARDGSGTLSVVSLVGTDREPDLRESLLDRVDAGELVVNLRAETDPARLEAVLRGTLASLDGVEARVEHLERLRPGRPVPTHRMA